MTDFEILKELQERGEEIIAFAKSIIRSKERAEQEELRPLGYLRVNKQIKHMKSLTIPRIQELLSKL